MTFDLSNPYEVSCFSALHPDRLVEETFRKPADLLDLNELLAGPTPYTTLQLAAGVEMHYRSDSLDAPNAIGVTLAARLGFEGLDVHGIVHFTGESGETDSAPGMDDDTFFALYEDLAQVCNSTGQRLWRKKRHNEQVSIRYDDLAQGDDFWFANAPHRFMGFKDFPTDSPTLEFLPGARILFCDDGFEITASTGSFTDRADRAPAGYWQRTGNQLLPAAD